jgi:hypothetical protein
MPPQSVPSLVRQIAQSGGAEISVSNAGAASTFFWALANCNNSNNATTKLDVIELQQWTSYWISS